MLEQEIRAAASALGFDLVGFAAAEALPAAGHLHDWIAGGFHAGMAWMARDPDSRIDPQRILPGARSVISVALRYQRPGPVPLAPGAPRISRYAWGDDYHEVVGGKLRELEAKLRIARPGMRTRIACDTSPVMDKLWAVAAGLGWQGRNTCLISPTEGSWLFLGEIFLDVPLPPDPPVRDRCGTCTACIDACPSGALSLPGVLDASRCISYLTVECRGEFRPDQAALTGEWLAGCDICQEVCPWNRRAPDSGEARFSPRPGVAACSAETWSTMSDAEYRSRIAGSALCRIKPPDMRRNARAVLGHRPHPGGH